MTAMAFFPSSASTISYSFSNIPVRISRFISESSTIRIRLFLVCFIDIFSKQMVTATSPLLLSSLTYIRQYVDDIILYFQYSVYHFSLFPATESPYLRVLKVLSILQTKECVLSHLREAFFLYRKAISCKIKIGPPDQLLICNATKKSRRTAKQFSNLSFSVYFIFPLPVRL